jgi:hypothetical protein
LQHARTTSRPNQPQIVFESQSERTAGYGLKQSFTSGSSGMFTLERAAQIFPETRTADVVPAITARFQLLSAEDQLALIWYAYLEMGSTITVAAPAAARMQFAERTLQEIKAMTFAEQSQVMCDLANRADTPISRVYATWSVNIKLGFWYQLGEWMAAGGLSAVCQCFGRALLVEGRGAGAADHAAAQLCGGHGLRPDQGSGPAGDGARDTPDA